MAKGSNSASSGAVRKLARGVASPGEGASIGVGAGSLDGASGACVGRGAGVAATVTVGAGAGGGSDGSEGSLGAVGVGEVGGVVESGAASAASGSGGVDIGSGEAGSLAGGCGSGVVFPNASAFSSRTTEPASSFLSSSGSWPDMLFECRSLNQDARCDVDVERSVCWISRGALGPAFLVPLAA